MSALLWIAFGIAFLLLMAWSLVDLLRHVLTYRYDERNPYRRYCRQCGQRQEMYCMDWADGPSAGWWENMAPLHDSCPVGHLAEDKLP